MIRKQLTGDLSLSTIVQGFWRLDDWKMTDKELAYFMKQCIERGVTTFDTAEIYSDTYCETMMGNAFRADPTIRQNIELISKTGIFKHNDFGYYDTSYVRIIQSCKESLKRLNTDQLDLYLIHREDPCIDVWETARALKDLKAKGMVREVGVSNFDPFKFRALNTAMGGELVTNQIEVNPVCFEHFNSGMIDVLVEERIKPMIWSPLAGGTLFTSTSQTHVQAMKVIREIADKYGLDASTIVYAWILYHPVGALPISGSCKIDRLDLAIEALNCKLEHYEWFQIYAASGQQVLR